MNDCSFHFACPGNFEEGVFGFYGYAVSPIFWLGFSVLVVKIRGFSVLNIVSVNGFWHYLNRFSGF